MTDRHQRRSLIRCLWLAAAVALILLLVVSSATHHPISGLCFVLVPVFLFAAVFIQERCFVSDADAVSCDRAIVPALFQRPPPSLI
jgi:hypothetical protein